VHVADHQRRFGSQQGRHRMRRVALPRLVDHQARDAAQISRKAIAEREQRRAPNREQPAQRARRFGLAAEERAHGALLLDYAYGGR
jgi:hypothetical protein